VSGGDEFAIIARYFAPLATAPGARGLRDDAAVLESFAGLVVTTDALVEGVHFLPDDPIDLIARKALRVNLSDLAAKGAQPLHYLLTLAWPTSRDPAAIAAFAGGLGVDQALFGCTLLGGDTVSTPGPMMVSITAIGVPLRPDPPSRSGARAGDDVWISGPIGDGALGLLAARGDGAEIDAATRAALAARYRLPSPRLDVAPLIAAVASASMDVSDGLFGDAAKIAAASGMALALDGAEIPRSARAQAWLAARPLDAARLFDGDDYEILFTAPPRARAQIAAFAAEGIRRIGRVAEGAAVTCDGRPAGGGYRHSLGANEGLR
jgi:thiamine-monophosphate kinase